MLEEVTEVILKFRCAKISTSSHEGCPINATVAADVDCVANMPRPSLTETEALEALDKMRLLQPASASHVELREHALHNRVLVGGPPPCHLQRHAHVEQAALWEFHQTPEDFLDRRLIGCTAHARGAGLVQETLPQDVSSAGASLPIQVHHLLASFDRILRSWFQGLVIDRRSGGPKAQRVLLLGATNDDRDMEAQQLVGHYPTTPDVGFGRDLATPDLRCHCIRCPCRSVILEVARHEELG
mmetsp:Transcript_55890/g.145784  ORF Transcript_55890/g.145784 Transcript_55890/m.145784 type:complete len:242 (+) Transcript_55890:746-1471(+)